MVSPEKNVAHRRHACHVAQSGAVQPAQRQLLAEEPLVIRVGRRPIATLMRTPGNDVELAMGFLLTEGIIDSRGEVEEAVPVPGPRGEANTVRVLLSAGADRRRARAPHRRVFSSCSICGTEQIKEVARGMTPFSLPPGRLTCQAVTSLAAQMRPRQEFFESTGASHAAALAMRPLDAASLGRMILREDIGRHNALDKAVGAAMEAGLDLPGAVLCLSSRLSFEMIAKAARAGIADVVGVSAPTTLAVDLAERLGMFLAGFARGDAFTVYAGIEALAT